MNSKTSNIYGNILLALIFAIGIILSINVGYRIKQIETLSRSHAVMWVDLEIQKRHLLMLARSHGELINQANSNTMATQGESGMFNLSQPVCYGCHEEL